MSKYKKAFSLVELLVSVTIIVVIMSVVLWNYDGFNDNLALNAAAQEMAVSIRQAQTYGINVKESASGGGQFNSAFGIYFNKNSGVNSGYRIFVDLDRDYNYDDPGESVELVNLRDFITISNICNNSTSGCTTPAGAVGVVATFLRPNPDAVIYFFNNSGTLTSTTFAKIELKSPRGTYKYVIIENTGQIRIE